MADGAAACVCVLFYGADDYCYRLARRVLNDEMCQFAQAHPDIDFRFGLNASSDAIRYFVRRRSLQYFPDAVIVDCQENIYKYPMMRRLFQARKISADIVMWFDDDSCIEPGTDVKTWFARLRRQISGCDVIGSRYTARFPKEHANWIAAQIWYAQKPFSSYVAYATGGWWVAKTDILQQFDWPPPDLQQKQGDVLFGELCRQQSLSLQHFRDNVWINANEEGVESSVTRKKSYNDKVRAVHGR